MNRRTLWAGAALTTAAALVARSGDACTADTECKGDRICNKGVCEQPSAPPPTPTPSQAPVPMPPGVSEAAPLPLAPASSCVSVASCQAGEFCIAGHCVKPTCTSAADCPNGTLCADHECRAAPVRAAATPAGASQLVDSKPGLRRSSMTFIASGSAAFGVGMLMFVAGLVDGFVAAHPITHDFTAADTTAVLGGIFAVAGLGAAGTGVWLRFGKPPHAVPAARLRLRPMNLVLEY